MSLRSTQASDLFLQRPPAPALSTVYWALLEQLREMGSGLTAAQQWELHLRLAHELYGRAVNGWALLAPEFSGGEGI